MKTSPPVLLYTVSLLLASEAWQGSLNLTCVYDSLETLTCNWTQSQNATEAQCKLTGHVPQYQAKNFLLSPLHPQTCQPHGIGTTMRSCKLIFEAKTYSFTVSDVIRLSVSCRTGENWKNESKDIKPFENLQLRPPHNVQMESDRKPSYNLTWQLPNVSHYLNGWLEYEVCYKKPDDPDKASTILPIKHDQQWVEIETLSPGTVYEAAVRVKVKDHLGNTSIWSHWSTMVKWRTYPKEPPSHSLLRVLLAFGISSISIFLIAAVLLVKTRIPKWDLYFTEGQHLKTVFPYLQSEVVYSPFYHFTDAASNSGRAYSFPLEQISLHPRAHHKNSSIRLQKVLRIDLPDPAEFFPSLTVVHGGDAQKWLSSPLSMDSFHIAVASPDVSVLEVLQKGNQEPCLLLPKEYLTPVDALETSGHSLSSCFVNRGYFFFHHQSLEIEPCKVYFTYDPFAQEDSGSEDGDSYQALHTTGNHPPLPSHSLMGSQEGVSLQREMKEPTQKVHQTISPTSMGRSPPAPAMEQGETQKDSDGIFPVCISPHRSAIGVPGVHEQPSSNANGMEVITDVATHASSLIGGNTPSFLQPIILNPGKASDLCRTASSSQVPNSEAYLSLRELQSQYNHQSV